MKRIMLFSVALTLVTLPVCAAPLSYYQVSGSAVNSPGSFLQTVYSADTGISLGPTSLAGSISGAQGSGSFYGVASADAGFNALHTGSDAYADISIPDGTVNDLELQMFSSVS